MNTKKYPKVLVISHNAFSTTSNNGKTYTSIFSEWPKENIAQLYFQNEVPDLSVCNNFFKITDEEMLLKKKSLIGKKITSNKLGEIRKSKSKVHSFVRKKPLPVFSFFRDVLWSTKKWDNKRLDNWIKDFSPDIIFFVGGGSSFSYKITNSIAKKYKLPVYLYYTDDYITPILTFDFFWWINWMNLRMNLKKVLRYVERIFVIGSDMAEEYSAKLDKNCIPIMNAVDIEKYVEASNRLGTENDKTGFTLAYFGGLHLNRWKSLVALGKAIEKVSISNNVSISLSIYTNQRPEEKIMKLLQNEPYVKYMGSVDSSGIVEEMNKYNGLVHVESFDFKMRQKTRLSISTKIPEYMASSKPILAIGPAEVSSMRYIARQEIAYVINTLKEEETKKGLLKMLSEKEKHSEIGKRGFRLAKENHSIEKNRATISRILIERFEV